MQGVGLKDTWPMELEGPMQHEGTMQCYVLRIQMEFKMKMCATTKL